MRKAKIGLIGCGNISDIYLRNAGNMFGLLDLVGCADLVADQGQGKRPKLWVQTIPYERLLARTT